jgi:von Willebrand factor type A domain
MKKLCILALLLCAFAFAQDQNKTIELIMDASGSMNAKLPEGISRIDAARSAVEKLVGSLPGSTQLAFRVYGHQSPKEKHDCNDIQLVVPFGALNSVQTKIVSSAKEVKAQGYTPITKAITQAAGDFSESVSGEKTIVLVSDGKETCEGDPCAAARALKKAGATLVIHTIGFGVDDAARFQLRCIADATGGTYSDAESAADLTKVLGMAAVAPMKKVEQEKQGGGFLEVQKADLLGHTVTDAVSGKEVASISAVNGRVNLPAGIYNVTFGAHVWKSVEVKAGKTTVLQPGVIGVDHASISGHTVRDSETGEEEGQVSSIKSRLTVLPGIYDVSFGSLVWPNVRVNAGADTILKPGVLKVSGASFGGHTVRTADGKEAGSVSSLGASIPLPPGSYTVEIKGKQLPFTLVEGQEAVLENK